MTKFVTGLRLEALERRYCDEGSRDFNDGHHPVIQAVRAGKMRHVKAPRKTLVERRQA